VPLARFSLDGSQHKNLRHVLNRGARDGLRLEIVPRADVPGRIAELQTISNAWLQLKAGREKRFSLGAFTPEYISRFDVAVLLHQDRPVAFANLFKTETRQDVSMDLMRHVADAPDDTMMFLFLKLMLQFQAEGYERLSLGMAPLSGMETHPLAPLWHRFAHVLYNRGERFYNFHGLRAFKQKFNPQWEPRYLVTVGGLNPWVVMTDVAAMIAGGMQGILSKH
jgi:phosphatidylglycerol lysyltransferase